VRSIVVTYSQFDSNIRVFYVFLGVFKNTLKYFIQRPISKPLYFYNAFFKILENTSFWAPSKNTHISYVTTMVRSHPSTTHIIFLWLFGGNVLDVMHVKMICNGKNTPTINEDTTTFTCHLSFMSSTWICLKPLLSHVHFPTIGA